MLPLFTGMVEAESRLTAVRPSPAHRYFRPRGGSRLRLSLGIAGQVLTFRTKAWLSPETRFGDLDVRYILAWKSARNAAQRFPIGCQQKQKASYCRL